MPVPESNLLLDKLPRDLRDKLLAVAEPISLPIRTVLYQPHRQPQYIHFITSGISSVITVMANGEGVEIGLHGREGAPESIHLLGSQLSPTECFAQIKGKALRFDFRRFQQEFFPLEPVRRVLLEHAQYHLGVVGQVAACNRLHNVDQRLARWLLMVDDRVGESEFRLTQEFLAEMIGSRRSTVAISAAALKRAGLIEYTRGEISIVNREVLEASACECYTVIRALLAGLRSVKAIPSGSRSSHQSHKDLSGPGSQ